jgi:hypothetical protein
VLGVFAVGIEPGYADVDWFEYIPRDGEQPSG